MDHHDLDCELADCQKELAAQRRYIANLECELDALQCDNERLRIVADFTYDWEYWIAPDGRYRYVSPACERITGYRPAEFQADPDLLKRIICAGDREHVIGHLDDEQNCAGVGEIEFQIVTRNGELRWIGHACQPIYQANGVWLGQRASNRDITRRKQAEADLREQQRFVQQIADTMPDLLYIYDFAQQRIIYVNQAAETVLGYSVDELQAMGTSLPALLIHPDDLAAAADQKRRCLTGQPNTVLSTETRMKDKAGNWHCMAIRETVFTCNPDGTPVQILGVAQDITERKRIEGAVRQSQAHLQAIVDNAAVGIFQVTLDGNWVTMNQRCLQMFGYTQNELVQMTYLDVMHPADRNQSLYLFEARSWRAHESHRVERRFLRNDGSTFWGDVSLTAIRNAEGQIESLLGVLVNITLSKDAEAMLQQTNARLRQQSVRDALTGLHNRRYLDETLPRELQRAIRRQQPLGVIMLDIDHFKQYNDIHGHDAGDALLRAVGAFLQTHIRGEDIACRYGGEEFLLVLPGASPEDTRQRAVDICAAVQTLQVQHGNEQLPAVTVSLGVAGFAGQQTTADRLIKAADQALYQAKRTGRNRVVVAPGVMGAGTTEYCE